MNYWVVLLLIAAFGIGWLFGKVIGCNKVMRDLLIGDLRVDRSDEDGPFLFLELNPDAGDFVRRKYVVLQVVQKDFVTRN